MTHMNECSVPVGFNLDVDECMMVNGTNVAVSPSDVLIVDTTSSVNANTGTTSLDASSGLWTLMRFSTITGAFLDDASGIAGVSLDAIPVGGKGRFRFHGDATVRIAGVAIVVGDNLIVNGNSGLSTTNRLTKSGGDSAASFKKIVGKAKAVGNGGTILVDFNGVSGFGGNG